MSGQTIDSSAVLGVDAETDDWKALGHCMDVIGECWDDGVSSGFVRANWTLLDRHLVTIINQAKKARKLLGGREDALRFASVHIEKCARCGEECRESSITSPSLVTALFCRHDSIYRTFANVDVWDAQRDAQRWTGGSPIIAHPPCRLWSSLAHMSTAPTEEKELTLWAVGQVRRWGGLLEHPQRSKIWKILPQPWKSDEYGITVEMDQWHWGHPASKPTRLYICGATSLPEWPLRHGKPWKTVTGITGQPGRRCTDAERQATPKDFAAWLLRVARSCKPNDQVMRERNNQNMDGKTKGRV